MKNNPLFLLTLVLGIMSTSTVRAELADQGLNSILQIIDQAIIEAQDTSANEGEASSGATDALVNLSRTLGTLSYSRLQCGEAGTGSTSCV